jgi:glycosyltransferase involved in cell wall biosynthesis
MKIDVHIISRNEAEILAYAFRHYQKFARVFLHDFGSTDNTRPLAYENGVTVILEDTGDKVDDRVNKRIKETCWHGTDADWVAVVDADELLYFPQGVEATLAEYTAQGLAVIKPRGYDMTSDTYPTTTGQIYEEIKHGAPNWLYDKPVLFSPKKVQAIEFWVGAHGIVSATLKDQLWNLDQLRTIPNLAGQIREMYRNIRGSKLPNPEVHSEPPVLLLHFHHIGPVERIGQRYDATRARMCDNNVQMNWGNVHEAGLPHAIKQRETIKSKLERVLL